VIGIIRSRSKASKRKAEGEMNKKRFSAFCFLGGIYYRILPVRQCWGL